MERLMRSNLYYQSQKGTSTLPCKAMAHSHKLNLWWSAVSLLNVFNINVKCIQHIWDPSSHLPFVLSPHQKYCADMFFAYGSCHLSLWWSAVWTPSGYHGHPWRFHMDSSWSPCKPVGECKVLLGLPQDILYSQILNCTSHSHLQCWQD